MSNRNLIEEGHMHGGLPQELADALRQADEELARYRKLYRSAFTRANTLAGKLERIQEARGNHPECDKHDEEDAVTCGWKRVVQDIDYVLATPNPEPAPDVAAPGAAREWVTKGLDYFREHAGKGEVGQFWLRQIEQIFNPDLLPKEVEGAAINYGVMRAAPYSGVFGDKIMTHDESLEVAERTGGTAVSRLVYYGPWLPIMVGETE